MAELVVIVRDGRARLPTSKHKTLVLCGMEETPDDVELEDDRIR